MGIEINLKSIGFDELDGYVDVAFIFIVDEDQIESFPLFDEFLNFFKSILLTEQYVPLGEFVSQCAETFADSLFGLHQRQEKLPLTWLSSPFASPAAPE